ncbi:hypothetical protein I4U23_017328 [Adineta vaga]|nr:hypothetical protein I4U23_017328 [Adineta vaga]
MASIFDEATADFKSNTSESIDRLQNTMTSMAQQAKTRNRFSDEEAEFIRPVNETKNATLDRLDGIKSRILSRRPDSNASQKEKDDYRELLRYADEGMERLRGWIRNIFDKVLDIVREIIEWICEEIDFIDKMASQNSAGDSQKEPSSSNQATNQNYASRTLTIVQDQNEKKLPTLILRLQERASSGGNKIMNWIRSKNSTSEVADKDIEQYVTNNLENFKRELLENIENFQQTILSARPNPAMEQEDPETYRIRSENYRELLRLSTEIAKRMEESLDDILTKYEQYIENIWTAIRDKQDVEPIRRQFNESLNQNMNQYWKPVFDSADDFIQNINQKVISNNTQ